MYFLSKLVLVLLLISQCLKAEIVIAYDTKTLGNAKKPTSHQKIELDKIHAIAQKNQIEVIFKPIPWKRSLLMLEKGLIDGIIQASYKKNRALYAHYPMINQKVDISKRLNNGNSYFIYRNINSKLRWNGKEFTKGGTVAAMDKYAVIDDLEKHSNIEIKIFNNNSDIIRKLASNQLDAYAGSAIVTDTLLDKIPLFAKSIVREAQPIRKKEYFLIFSKITYKQKSEKMEKIWNGLKEFNQLNK